MGENEIQPMDDVKIATAKMYVLGFPRKEIYAKIGITPATFEKWVRSPEFIEAVTKMRKTKYDRLIARRENDLLEVFNLLVDKVRKSLERESNSKKQVQELNFLLREFREFMKLERKVILNEPDTVNEINITEKILNLNIDVVSNSKAGGFVGNLDKKMIQELLWDKTDDKK